MKHWQPVEHLEKIESSPHATWMDNDELIVDLELGRDNPAIRLPDNVRLCQLVDVDDPVLAFARQAYWRLQLVRIGAEIDDDSLTKFLNSAPDEVKGEQS